MKIWRHKTSLFTAASLLVFFSACGSDDTKADRLGIGAECANNEACSQDNQQCLTEFKGGYCGKSGCTSNRDCPEASACVVYGNGKTYCFRICLNKTECNANRSLDNEANCSSSITFVEPATDIKACIPPSSGTKETDTDASSSVDAESKDDKKDK